MTHSHLNSVFETAAKKHKKALTVINNYRKFNTCLSFLDK